MNEIAYRIVRDLPNIYDRDELHEAIVRELEREPTDPGASDAERLAWAVIAGDADAALLLADEVLMKYHADRTNEEFTMREDLERELVSYMDAYENAEIELTSLRYRLETLEMKNGQLQQQLLEEQKKTTPIGRGIKRREWRL